MKVKVLNYFIVVEMFFGYMYKWIEILGVRIVILL